MAHCPYQELVDLEAVLDRIRKWNGIREPKAGIFYLKQIPFLHFHIKDGKRWADARLGKNWGPSIDIPLESTLKQRSKFQREVERRYTISVRTAFKNA